MRFRMIRNKHDVAHCCKLGTACQLGNVCRPHVVYVNNLHYYAYRHGHSVANAQDLIVSSLEEGIQPDWGLTDVGRVQADQCGEELLVKLGKFNPGKLVIASSPFSRCIETAARIGSHFDIHFHDEERFLRIEKLRERFFGSYDKTTSMLSYNAVWKEDEKNAEWCPPGGGDSVTTVALRVKEVMQELEERYAQEGYNIVIVSHGDVLSILSCLLRNDDLCQHRKYGTTNCEIVRFPPPED